ncbi:hypothetical protein GGF41_000745 [Coemansia sp. RSA 2531]|nr:hypothetical protein GGF41_000745 [Coemansia sp. RSA 2531]
MAATALALHTLELDQTMDRQLHSPADSAFQEDYADLLEYFDPDEPAYRRAVTVQMSLRASRDPVINLGTAEPVVDGEQTPMRVPRSRRRSSGARSKHNGRRRSSHASNTSNNV